MLRDVAQKAVEKAVKQKFGVKITPLISYSDPKLGDFSTNVAFQLAEQIKQPPNKIAEQLASAISDLLIDSAAPAGAGFVNITFNDKAWLKELTNIDDTFAHNSIGRGKKAVVEFISANPTGPLTLANARGGSIGDVIANVLSFAGYDVEREYYINDFGNQITELLRSIKSRAGLISDKEVQYSGDYVSELATEMKDHLEKAEADKLVVSAVMEAHIKPAIKRLGINFDTWFSEKEELHESSRVKEMLIKLNRADLTEEKEGAVWLKADGEDRERVLVKKDGEYTYLLGDIAYHWNKLKERGFDLAINLWGADHAGQVPSLNQALEKLGLGGKLNVVLFQLVRLIRGGQVMKVSKRAGTYVTLDELLNEVPPVVARFFFLMRSSDTPMDFDLDLAKEQSQKNPYYYVMYAFTRAHSILAKAKAKGLKSSSEISELSSDEKLLIRQLSMLPELVNELSRNYEVHKLTFYGMELARLFHEFYEGQRIIDLSPDEAGPRLFVLEKTITAMKAYWALLGITPQERM